MNLGQKFISFFETLFNSPRFQTQLLVGLWTTVRIALLGLLIGIVIGTLIAVVRVAPKYKLSMRILDKVCTVYVAIFRGTPIVVQLLVTYYLIIPLLGIKGVDASAVGTIVFGMNSGAYVSEIMRGGINSVDIGQMEAGRAVGLSYGTTMLKIVVPQAIKNIVPTLGNELITLIKETSVLSFIAIKDLYSSIKDIAMPDYSYAAGYLFMALIYIILVLLITLLIKIVEKQFAKSDRQKNKTERRAKA